MIFEVVVGSGCYCRALGYALCSGDYVLMKSLSDSSVGDSEFNDWLMQWLYCSGDLFCALMLLMGLV